MKQDQKDAVKEVQSHIDSETIPSKKRLSGEESVIVFDLETTGIMLNMIKYYDFIG